METYDSGFAISTPPVPEPTPAPRPEAGRGKAAAVTVAVLAGVFAALCIIIGVGISHLRAANESPVTRTLREVVPGMSAVESFMRAGGTVVIDGYVGDRLIPTVPADRNFGFYTELNVDEKGRMEAAARLFSGEDIIGDLAVFFSDRGVALTSDALLDGSLVIPFAGAAERLEHSVFAPDSGSKYAMEAESFEALMEMAQAYDSTVKSIETAAEEAEGISVADVEAVLSDIRTRLARVEGLKRTESKRDVKLLDRTAKATVYTYAADEQYLFDIIAFLRDEWRNNQELERIIRAGLRSSVAAGGMTEAETEKAVQNAYSNLSVRFHTALKNLEKAYRDVSLDVTLELAVKSRYLVAADLTVTVAPAEVKQETNAETAEAGGAGEAAAHPANGLAASLRFASDPAKNPSFALELYTYADGETTSELAASRTDVKENTRTVSTWTLAAYEYAYDQPHVEDRIVFVFEHRPNGAYSASLTQTSARGPFRGTVLPEHREEKLTLAAEGTFYQSKYLIDIGLSRLTVTHPDIHDGEPFTCNSKELNLHVMVSGGALTAPPLPKNEPDPLTMSEAEWDTLLSELDGRLATFRRSVNEALGKEVFHPAYIAERAPGLTIDGALDRIAADAETGHVIVASNKSDSADLRIYEPTETGLREVSAVKLERPVAAMDADNGRIAISYEPTDRKWDGTVYLFDAGDGHRLNTFEVITRNGDEYDYIDCLALDGDTLFVATADQYSLIYAVNAETGEVIRTLGEHFRPVFTVDRENHRLFSLEQDVPRPSCALYDTLTGERLAAYAFSSSLREGPYMTGSHILVGNIYLDMNCESVNPVANVTETPQGQIGAVLRMDGLLHAYLTVASDGKTLMTELFSAQGAPIAVLPDTVISVMPFGERRYLLLTADQEKVELVVLELQEQWLLLSDGE